jgi:DNA-binding NarL/FixJ family response regulator
MTRSDMQTMPAASPAPTDAPARCRSGDAENIETNPVSDYHLTGPGASAGEGGAPMTEEVGHPRLRVLVVDDHAVVRAGFMRILDATEDLEAAGEAGTAADALALAAEGHYDVVMLDISLPDANVLETVAALRRRNPGLPILIVSMHPEDQYAVNLLRAGASGFFAKAGEATELVAALRLVASGRRYVSPALAEALALEATGVVQEPSHRQLSNREFQVFIGLAAGRTVTDLADAMCLSVKTVSTYRTRVLEKMNLERNADLTAYALRHSLLA